MGNVLAAQVAQGESVAVSIIYSGDYEDDEVAEEEEDTMKIDEMWYTGQGQNDLLGNKKQTVRPPNRFATRRAVYS
eukprot:1189599-Prorocentrum_minimum.AAC.7